MTVPTKPFTEMKTSDYMGPTKAKEASKAFQEMRRKLKETAIEEMEPEVTHKVDRALAPGRVRRLAGDPEAVEFVKTLWED